MAIHGIQRQRIGEVAGVLDDRELIVLIHLVRLGPVALTFDILFEVIGVVVATIAVALRHIGHLQQVVVVDVPVQLGVELGILGCVMQALGIALHIRKSSCTVPVLLCRNKTEESIPDQRTTDVGAVRFTPALVAITTAVERPRNILIGVLVAGWQRFVREIAVGIALAQSLGLPDDLGPEMEIIGTALADLVDHTTI
ncbi:hypothetical protein D3C81_1228990 [compost metagenome]